MFLKYFKSSFASQYLLIAVIGLIVWTGAFIHPVEMPLPEGKVPFYSVLYSLLNDTPRLAVVFGFLLVLVSSFLLNDIFNKQEIVTKNSSLAALLFIAFSGYYPQLLTLHPVNICLFLLLLIFRQLFETYHRTESLDLFYAAGFYVGIGTFFYFPFLAIYLLVLLSFIIFRSNSWREWTSSLIGLITPYVFLATFYFWFDEFRMMATDYGQFFSLPQSIPVLPEPGYLILTSILFLFCLFSLASSLSHVSEKTIEGRKKSLLVYWLVVIILISFPFAGSFVNYHPLFLTIITSVLLTTFFLQRKKTFWIELFFMLFLASIVINNLIAGF